MTVAGIMLVRDEADIIGPIVHHLLGEVDFVIVSDNGSVDGTRQILDDIVAWGAPLTVLDDKDPGHWQSNKTTAMARRAAAAGAEWVLPVDADEWWYSPFGRIGDVLSDFGPQWLVAEAVLYDHVATGADPEEPDPTRRIGWRRREPSSLPKVACRCRDDLVIGDGNHRAYYRGGATVTPGQLVVRHFPYRTAEQMVAKAKRGAAALALTDLPEDTGAHWRHYAALIEAHGEEAMRDVFREHFWAEHPGRREDLILDPVGGLTRPT